MIGREVELRAASLADHATFWAAGQTYPMLQSCDGQTAPGIITDTLSAAEIDRLIYYEGPYAYDLTPITVMSEGAQVETQIFLPPTGQITAGAHFDLADWQARFGPVMRQAAVEIMHAFGTQSATEIAAKLPVILTRAQACVNAANWAVKPELSEGFHRDEVTVLDHRRPYSHFFAMDEIDVTYPQFSGPRSGVVERAVMVSADAVTVLPYDPVQDAVVLIEQFRSGPYLRGDAYPWMLEAIAGRLDPFETPEQTARREAIEEAGLQLGALKRVGRYYASPGAKTEYLISFIGLCDLSGYTGGVGGLDSEAEDIRTFKVPFADLEDALTRGEIANAPLLVSSLWLQQMRPQFQAEG